MAKLPDKFDLAGNAPKKSGRSYLSADDFAAPDRIAAQGMKAVAGGINKLGQMSLEAAQEETALDLMRADLHKTTHILEAERSFDTDTNYDNYGPRFELASRAIDDGAAQMIRNPKAREKWRYKEEMKNQSAKDRLMNQALARKRDAKVAEIQGILDSHKANYASPNITDEDRARIESDMDAAIGVAERAAMIGPSQALQLRRSYMGGAVAEDYERRILKDPASVLKELEGEQQQGVMPLRSMQDLNAIPRSGGAPNSREHMGPRKGGQHAGWDIPGKAGEPVLAIGSGTVIAAGTGQGYGHYIDVAYEDGTVHRLAHLGGGKTQPFARAWKPGDTIQSGEELGFLGHSGNAGPEFPHVHYEIFKNRENYDRSKSTTSRQGAALRENPRAYFEGRASANTQPTDMAQRGLTTYAGLSKQNSTVDSSDLPPVNTGRAHLLTSDQRRALTNRARVALGVEVSDQVAKDIARLSAGLDPETGPDGLTSIDRAEGLLSGPQVTRLRLKWEQAKAEREVIAPMEFMSDEEAGTHIAALRDQPWLQKRASEAWKKQLKLRDDDPVQAVAQDQDVVEVAKVAQQRYSAVGIQVEADGSLVIEETQEANPEGRQSALAAILEARIAAQERRGISEDMQRILTRREAKNLLRIPSATGMDDRKYRAALEEAASRAVELYGPEYGPRALEEAIGFQRGTRTNEKRRFEDRILAALASGNEVSAADMRQYNELTQTVDRMAREFTIPDLMAADDTKPYIAQPNMASPSEQHITWLKANIQDPSAIAVFDGKFGEGAAAKALYAPSVKTTRDTGPSALPKQQTNAGGKGFLQSLLGD